jgi:transcription elongation factor GreA
MSVPLTVAGAEKLKQELHRLKTVDRPSVIAAIAEARSHGDLSENAEYDAAKERQGFVEGRIQEIEGKLANALVIDPKRSTPKGAWCSVQPSISKMSRRASRSATRSSATTRPI